jgi:hypothetical protein
MSWAPRTLTLAAVAFGLAILACLGSCKLDTEPDVITSEITGFDLLRTDNSALARDVIGTIRGDNISLSVPLDTDVTSLVPTIEHSGARLSPASKEAQNFSEPVPYTLLRSEGGERVYTVTVTRSDAGSKDITRFRIGDAQGTITGTDIAVTVPFDSDLTALTGVVTHTGVSVSPESGSQQDFSQPVTYTVSAQDGTTKTYTVTVSSAASDSKDITDFTIGETRADITGTQIMITLPFGTDLTALAPTISHNGVSVSPGSGEAQDFSNPVLYTVTASDGTTQEYTAQVNVTPNSAKEITRFTIDGRAATIVDSSISLSLPFGADITRLSPIVQHTGQSVSPASRTRQNFTQPVTYTVTAADGSTHEYTVTVTVAPSSAKDITGFEILGNAATIDGTTINVTVPSGTMTSSLTPSIATTGTSVSPASGVAQNFSRPVSYVVTAADGSTQTYAVFVTVAPSDAKDITRFVLLGRNATIAGDNITLTLPFGTDVNPLIPAIMHNGASVDPASFTPQDFTGPVMYTVTAGDGSTHVYTVTVTVAQNDAREITSFAVGSAMGVIVHGSGSTPGTITVTVPFATTLATIMPTIAHTGMSVSPASGAMQNFANGPVTYTVTAQNGMTRSYAVTVQRGPNSAKNITMFTIDNMNGTLNLPMRTVTLTLPFGTDRSALSPTIVVSENATIDPTSGTARNFSSTQPYTVTAEDNTSNVWNVTVNLAAGSSANDITSFTLPAVPNASTATIGTNTISMTVPNGTGLGSLAPTIVTSANATVSPPSTTARDFSNSSTTPLTYTVTAQNGTSQKTYSVTITEQAPSGGAGAGGGGAGGG